LFGNPEEGQGPQRAVMPVMMMMMMMRMMMMMMMMICITKYINLKCCTNLKTTIK
jgi:hypothetical protein